MFDSFLNDLVLPPISRNWPSFTLLWWFGFRLDLVFATVPAASKKTLASKVVKIDSKIIISPC